tara:strand:- start:196 stop:402 length:207 start_codon:yes stop_codon:yes gene_type:complete
MNTTTIRAMIAESNSLEGSAERYMANKLMSCVLDIVEKDGQRHNFQGSSYFWEKFNRATEYLEDHKKD